MSSKLLYVTWDGPNQWYLESLFFPLFEHVRRETGISPSVLQFSYATEGETQRTARAAWDRQIEFESVRTSPRLATRATGAAWMTQRIARVAARVNPVVIAGRSLLPAFMSIAVARCLSVPLIFDADGLPHDERIDDAGGRAGFRYWASRAVEQICLGSADAIIVRSEAGREILQARAGGTVDPHKFWVASNGRNPQMYSLGGEGERAKVRSELGLAPNEVAAFYLGSIGPKYRPDWLRAFLQSFLESDDSRRMFFVTAHRDAAESISANLAPSLSARIRILRVEPQRVPRLLLAADLGLAFIRDSFSSLAVSPIKLGEYLLAGCPVLCTSGVGDVDRIASEARGAISIIRDPVEAGRKKYLTREDQPGSSATARDIGLRYFNESLARDVYCQVVQGLL